MKSTEATDAKHLLLRATRAELLDVRAFIDMRLGQMGQVQAARSLSDEVLMLICDVCRSEGIDAASVQRMQTHAAYKGFVEKVDQYVDPFMEMVKGYNRIRKRAFLRIAITLLLHNLKDMNVPVSALMLMNHIHRLQSVVDRAFPGYAKNGLLHMVVRMERLDESAGEETRERKAGKIQGSSAAVQRRT